MSSFHDQQPKDARAYSIVSAGTRYKLSTHFRLHEMQCSDGSFAVLVHPALITGLERLRHHFGCAVVINSGYRTHAYNAEIDGARQSRHLWGMAADIVVGGVSPSQVATQADKMGFGGVGQYDTFVHVDVQGQDRRWRG